MKHYTVASCFTSFVLPLVLFVSEFEERRKAVLTGCLAWNISLFPDPALRKQHIHNVWQMIEADNTEPAPPGLERGYKNDLWMLSEQKRDLFPWLMVNIPRAELRRNGTREMLSVQAGKSDVEEIELSAHPDPLGLPIIIEVLRGIQRDTAEQVALMERVSGAAQAYSVTLTGRWRPPAIAYSGQTSSFTIECSRLSEGHSPSREPKVRLGIGWRCLTKSK